MSGDERSVDCIGGQPVVFSGCVNGGLIRCKTGKGKVGAGLYKKTRQFSGYDSGSKEFSAEVHFGLECCRLYVIWKMKKMLIRNSSFRIQKQNNSRHRGDV